MEKTNLIYNKHFLYLANITSFNETTQLEREHLSYLRRNFCGKVTYYLSDLIENTSESLSTLYYITGDMDVVCLLLSIYLTKIFLLLLNYLTLVIYCQMMLT